MPIPSAERGAGAAPSVSGMSRPVTGGAGASGSDRRGRGRRLYAGHAGSGLRKGGDVTAWLGYVVIGMGVMRLLIGAAPLFAAAREISAAADRDLDLRGLAASLLGRGVDHRDSDRELLASLLSPQHPLELQAACVTALAAGGDDRLPSEFLAP